MADESSVSFELDRFEWVDPTRLEIDGSWNGVSRKLARAVLVIEVDGRRRRLKAAPGDAGTPEQWHAAFNWDGDDIPHLPGAELEVGRGIVVDLPRPRSSKARAALPKDPIPASTREERELGAVEALANARTDAREAREAVKKLREERDALRPRAEEADSLRAERDALRTRAEKADALRAERDELRARLSAKAEEVHPPAGELDELRAKAQQAEALWAQAQEADALRARADEADALRAERDELRADLEEAKVLRARAAEADDLRTRAEEAEAELISLYARAEDAEEALAALRAQAEQVAASRPAADAPPDIARLRAELDAVERERTELRAQLDATSERLENATKRVVVADETQPMPPTSTDGDDGQTRRFDRVSDGEPARRTRRPAERTAKRAPEPSTSLADKVTDWVAAIIGAEDEEDDGTKNGHTTTRTRRSPSRTAAPARTRQRPAAVRTAAPRHDEEPSWLLRAAAIALLGLLMVALLLLLTSIL